MKSWQEIKKFTAVVRLSHKRIIWIWMGYGCSSALLPFINLYFSAHILNQLIAGEYEKAFYTVLWMASLTLLFSLISKAFYNRLEVIRHTSIQQTDQKLLYKAMVIEYEQLENQKTMDTLRRTRNSINGSGGMGSAIYHASLCCVALFKIVFSFIAIIFLMIQIHTWDIYLFTFIVVLMIFLYIKNIFAKKHGEYLETLCKGNDRSNAMINYLWSLYYRMDIAKEIRLFQMDDLFIKKSEWIEDDPTFIEFGKKNGKLFFVSDMLGQVLSYSAYIYVASLAIRSIISIGKVLYMSGIILNAVNAITEFQNAFAQWVHQMSYLNAFYDFLKLPNMHYDGTLPIEKRDDGEYVFEFRDVSFAYPQQEDYVLKHVNIKFNLQEKLAIVGMNGAGKTTIVKLLCRLYEPSEGEILLNGINIAKYDYAEYTSIFSVVFQDFALFSYELDENIAGGSEVDKNMLMDVLQRLNIQKRVNSFRDKEHSLLFKDNGDGVNVSGGEAQKLAIARALYKNAPFVILDEPTAALDPISEAEIYENFNTLVENKTTLYISHRMSSCKFCHRILVMENGEIVEEGSHESLLSNQKLYASLWKAQAEYYENDIN